ncbi:hypothetical protein HPB51_029532 [Rhipicephalus microplus]|uniref:BTB domain-containing protein n=1 Tax=Rhipicephalus microplus TaxID=6941 RepID=A0A9J6CU59_RHIMP|nr:hypothetical protein HPB51_029532 [Rhipicephalus microplus]
MDTVKWCLKVSPNGLDEKIKDYISLYLLLKSSNQSELCTKITFYLLDVNKEERETVLSPKALYFVPGKHWGLQNFARTVFSLYRFDELLLWDKLTIFCEVHALEATREISGHNNHVLFDVPVCWLPGYFRDLLRSGDLNDILLSISGRRFRPHKAILSAKSSVFAAMCQHNIKDENQVDI